MITIRASLQKVCPAGSLDKGPRQVRRGSALQIAQVNLIAAADTRHSLLSKGNTSRMSSEVSQEPRHLKVTTVINAPVEHVRRTFLDWPSYPEWTSFIDSLKVASGQQAEPGQTLHAVLHPQGSSAMTIKPTLLVNDEREFRWKGQLFVKGLFDGEHYFQFKEEPTKGTTTFVQGEQFGGVLFGPLWYFIGQGTTDGFVAFNEALKKRCEATAAAS